MLVATLDAQLAKTPWQNLDVLTAYLADHPHLLELPPPKLAEELNIPVNHAAVLLASPEVYERLVAATLQRTIRPQDHAEIIRTIAEKAKDPDQPLGQQVLAAKFVAQQTGVLRATKTEQKEEKVFRVILEHNPHAKGVSDVFDTSTRLVNPELPQTKAASDFGGGEEVVDADFTPSER